MNIKMLDNTFDSDGNALLTGEVYDDLSEADEDLLIDRDMAVETDETPRAEKKFTVAEIAETLPEMSNEDLTALRQIEEKSDKPRNGVLAAIDREIKRRQGA